MGKNTAHETRYKTFRLSATVLQIIFYAVVDTNGNSALPVMTGHDAGPAGPPNEEGKDAELISQPKALLTL